MKALMLHSENSAVGKYRIWNPAKYLEQIGWETSLMPDEFTMIQTDHTKAGDKCWECRSKGSDIIVMQRPDKPESIALGLALRDQCDAPLVFEIDDNIYDIAKSSTSYQYWYPGSPLREIAELLMSRADAITVTTPELVKVYEHLNPNIYVLPNYQDMDDWSGVVNKNIPPMVTIGWQGSSTHYDDLHMIRRVLKKLLRNRPNVQLKLIGMHPDFLSDTERVEIITKFAPIREMPKYLAGHGFDIGIAPVVNRAFNHGKSNIKWQEYSALGIPTVASKYGPYGAIQNGVTGYLADTEDEWYAYLDRLVLDAGLRKSIGQNAQREVEANFSMKNEIGRWDSAYRDIISRYKDDHGRQPIRS